MKLNNSKTLHDGTTMTLTDLGKYLVYIPDRRIIERAGVFILEVNDCYVLLKNRWKHLHYSTKIRRGLGHITDIYGIDFKQYHKCDYKCIDDIPYEQMEYVIFSCNNERMNKWKI